jgi:hypothetical protein
VSNVSGITTPTPDVESLQRSVAAVIEQLQVLTGERGGPLDKAVTFEDLVGLRLADANVSTNWRVTEFVPAINNVIISDDSAANLTPSLNYVGEFATAPTQQDLGANWKQNAVYKNSTDGKSYVLTGSPLTWVVYLVDGLLFSLTIESTNGTVFRVGQNQSTTLIGRLFKNGAEVTDQTPESWFRWRRVSIIPQNPPNDDLSWNALYQAGYKQVTISVDDVFSKATFFCDVISP